MPCKLPPKKPKERLLISKQTKRLRKLPIERSRKQTSVVILAGGPCSGKSTMAEELRQLGYNVHEEVARKYINSLKEKDDNEENLKAVLASAEFTNEVLRLKLADEASAIADNTVSFFDSGLICGLSYRFLHHFSLDKELEQQINAHLHYYEYRHKKVFFFEMLPLVQDGVRLENDEQRQILQESFRRGYKNFGYELIDIPLFSHDPQTSIKARLNFILKAINAPWWAYYSKTHASRPNTQFYHSTLTHKGAPSLFIPSSKIQLNQEHVPYRISGSEFEF